VTRDAGVTEIAAHVLAARARALAAARPA
jgi:hypothetical protein